MGGGGPFGSPALLVYVLCFGFVTLFTHLSTVLLVCLHSSLVDCFEWGRQYGKYGTFSNMETAGVRCRDLAFRATVLLLHEALLLIHQPGDTEEAAVTEISSFLPAVEFISSSVTTAAAAVVLGFVCQLSPRSLGLPSSPAAC